MVDELYQKAILQRAKAAIGAGRLESPDGAATVDNPMCGDRVTMQVRVVDGAIADLRHKVRGCVLCEAAASVLGEHATGMTPDALHRTALEFRAMIESGGPIPESLAALETFAPVRTAKSRHRCVLLPFEALTQAMANALETAAE